MASLNIKNSLGDMNLEIRSNDFIEIYPTIDQIINLNTMSIKQLMVLGMNLTRFFRP